VKADQSTLTALSSARLHMEIAAEVLRVRPELASLYEPAARATEALGKIEDQVCAEVLGPTHRRAS
jgi:hypothetical protein